MVILSPSNRKQRLIDLLLQNRQGLLLVTAVVLAYGLDYLFNLVAGRLLVPAEFSIIVALAGIGQVLVVASRVIQTVVTRYVAGFQAENSGDGRTTSFFRVMFRSAWSWGLVAMLVMGVASYPLSRFLQIDEIGPLLALAVATLLLVVRPVIGGVLQGVQQFGSLGVIQVLQAFVRLLLGALLMWLGWGALGAMLALPVASLVALIYGWRVLQTRLRPSLPIPHGISVPDLFRYSAYAAVGLIGYALLVNMDAILVKRFFAPEIAGNYGAAVTLGKIVQFFPLAIIMILFPKAAQRRAAQRDPADVLLPALLVVGLFCAVIAVVYGLFAELIVRLTVGAAYQVDGRLLGLVGLAMGLLSLANVWLNYFLSAERPFFVYLIGGAIIIQVVAMSLFHAELWHLPAIMSFNGGWLTVAGVFLFVRERRT